MLRSICAQLLLTIACGMLLIFWPEIRCNDNRNGAKYQQTHSQLGLTLEIMFDVHTTDLDIDWNVIYQMSNSVILIAIFPSCVYMIRFSWGIPVYFSIVVGSHVTNKIRSLLVKTPKRWLSQLIIEVTYRLGRFSPTPIQWKRKAQHIFGGMIKNEAHTQIQTQKRVYICTSYRHRISDTGNSNATTLNWFHAG